MGISYPVYKKYLCPECGSEPEVKTVMYGRAHCVLCSSCGWYGDTLDAEISPFLALSHWNDKVFKYNQKIS